MPNRTQKHGFPGYQIFLQPQDIVCIESARRNDKLSALEALWNQYRIGLSYDLPPRSVFSARTLLPWLGNIMIIGISNDFPHFRISLAGVKIGFLIGGDLTGHSLDQIADRTDALMPYEQCATDRIPVYCGAFHTRNHERNRIEQLILPCARDGRTVDTLLVGLYATPVARNIDRPTVTDPMLGRGA